MRCTHFVGVAPDQRPNAIRVWGQPHYEHPRADWSLLGELSGDDVVILGRNAFPKQSERRKKLNAMAWSLRVLSHGEVWL